jgi:hypothetical protein
MRQTLGPQARQEEIDLIQRDQVHWAGNLNIYVGNQSVERHVAAELGILPGQFNMAMSLVGHGYPDAYRFKTRHTASDWDLGLYTTNGELSLSGTPLPENQWTKAHQMTAFLKVLPPQDCDDGTVEVHVDQKSTGRTATVEFSMNPRASSPGYFTL